MRRYVTTALISAAAFAMWATWTHRRRSAAQSARALLDAYLEAWESGDPDRLDEVIADGYTGHVHALAGVDERDREALAEQLQAHAETFSDTHFSVEDCVANRGRIAARARMEGTHAEDGREVEMLGMLILRVEDGQIVEEWASWDYLGMAEQLGVELAVEPNGSG